MRDKRFSRIYLEITNLCNRSCSFCPGTRRRPGSLSVKDFRLLAHKLRPYSDYLYLHVMGEPLTHPKLAEILSAAADIGFHVILTTNGTLLPQKQEVLLCAPALHKVSISLHSFEANEIGGFESYLTGCTDFGRCAAEKGILVCYRLWNLDGAETVGLHEQNDAILQQLRTVFPEPWQENSRGFRLADRVYLEYGERFDWPDLAAPDRGAAGTCHGLRDQLAVLCDGSVVPCCLDHDGDLVLGNLFRQELDEILASPTAEAILDGFRRREKVMPLCRRCGYAVRFG